MSILVEDVLVDGKETSIYVEENVITEVGRKHDADVTIDGKGKAAIPGLINAHTHAAMTLMRGYADDLELHDWLQNHIWPLEAKLEEEDVYWGAKLACLEMIKTGTTCFNDMYWHPEGTAKAAEEMGIRGVISSVFIDLFDNRRAEEQIRENERLMPRLRKRYSDRIVPALGPHAVYTVSKDSLDWIRGYSQENNTLVHFHLAETRKENEDCLKRNGKRPIPYLDGIDFLTDKLVACHSVWLTKDEIRTMAEHNVKVVNNPTSNMKLATGGVIAYPQMKAAGMTVALGTDGCASNNNLDMFEAMKFASLLQKAHLWDQTVMPAKEAYQMATTEGAKALNLNAGAIEEGMLADIILIDLKRPELTPHYNIHSDMVYAANGSCVNTTICDGKVLMEDRRVEGEEMIMERASEVAKKLVKNA